MLLVIGSMFTIIFTFNYVLEKDTYTSVGGIGRLILWEFLLFIGCAGVSAILIYITELQDLLRKFIDQNGRLLDGMHEGLLILSKSTKKTLFFNKPA